MNFLLKGVVFSACSLFPSLLFGPILRGASAQEAQPKVVVAKPTFDFGVVEQGTPVEVVFDIRNEGSAPLQILGIQPACGCTAAMVDSNTVLPGEVSHLKSTLSTVGFSGRQAKTIRLSTNDPTNRSVTLTLQGDISAPIVLEPPRVYFPRIKGGESASQSVTIKVRPDLKAQILEIKAGSDKVSIAESDFEGGKKIVVGLAPSIPVGTFSDRITIKTSSDKYPMVQLPVFALIEGDWRVEPRSVVFGSKTFDANAGGAAAASSSTSSLQRVVRLIRVGKGEGKVLSVSSNNPAIQTTLKSVEGGKEFEVLVTVTPSGSGMLKGEITVVTDHADPSQTKLTIPVFAEFSIKGE